MDEKKVKLRVNSITAFLLVSVSLTVDIIQALLDIFIIGGVINRIISPFVWLSFLTWFYFLGIKFFKNPKNQTISIIGFVIEMIPYIDILPGWTVSTIILINTSRREDRGRKPKTEQAGIALSKRVIQQAGYKTREVPKESPAVGSEIKAKPGQNGAEKELASTQTGGNKPYEPKPEEEQDWKNSLQQKDGQMERRRGEEKERRNNQKPENEAGETVSQKNEEKTNSETDQQRQNEKEISSNNGEGELEDIVMQKGETANLMDPYREPVPKKDYRQAPSANKEKDEEQPYEEAA